MSGLLIPPQASANTLSSSCRKNDSIESLTPRLVPLSAEFRAIALTIGPTTAANAIGHKVADSLAA